MTPASLPKLALKTLARLNRPSARVIDPHQHREAQIMSMLMSLRLLLLFLWSGVILVTQQEKHFAYIVIHLPFYLILYGLARTRFYRWSIDLFLVGQALIYIFTLPSWGLSNLLYSVTLLLTASLFLETALLAVYGFFMLAGFGLMSVLANAEGEILTYTVALQYIFFGVAYVLFLSYLREVELAEKDQLDTELKATHLELDQFFTLSLDLFAIADHKGYFLKVNSQWETLLGYSVDELKKSPYLEFIHPDDQAATLTAMSLLDAQQPLFHFVNRYRCQNGNYCWLEWQSMPRGALIYAVARDVTARKAAEAQLQASEQRYRLLADNITDMISLHTPDRKYIYASPSWEKITGYTLAELQEIDTTEMLHPDEIEAVRQQGILRVMGGETVQGLEYRLKKKNGEYIWVEAFAQPIKNTAGEVVNVLVSTRDITARKESELTLLASERLNRSIISIISEGIVLQGQAGEIQRCNQAAEQILGLTADQMQGITSIDPRWRAIHEDETPFLGETHPAMITLKTGLPTTNTIMGVHKPDGELTWILINTQPIFQPGEALPSAVVASFTDITQLKTAEKQRLELLAEKQRAKVLTDFMRDTSHDLRTPLTVIGTSLYILQKTTDETRRQTKIKEIEKQVVYLTAVLEQLQIMAMLDSLSELPLYPKNPHLLIQEVMAAFSGQAEAKNIQMLDFLTRKSAQILLDEETFILALRNLLRNALQFTLPNGQITLRSWVVAETNSFMLEILDNGIGIESEHLPYVFDRFFKGNQARTSLGGAGLGLAITKRIIEFHGGEIRLASQLGRGTHVTLTFPLARR